MPLPHHHPVIHQARALAVLPSVLAPPQHSPAPLQGLTTDLIQVCWSISLFAFYIFSRV